MGRAGLRARDLERDVVDVAPEPVLTGLERLDDRVRSFVKVKRRVLAGGLVATADVPALRAPPEMDPPPARQQALDAAGPTRIYRLDGIEVRADTHVGIMPLGRDPSASGVRQAREQVDT